MDQQVKETTWSVKKKRERARERDVCGKERQKEARVPSLSKLWPTFAMMDAQSQLRFIVIAYLLSRRPFQRGARLNTGACKLRWLLALTHLPATRQLGLQTREGLVHRRPLQQTPVSECTFHCVLSFLHSFPHFSRPFKEPPSPRRKGTVGCTVAKGGSCI